MCGGNVHTLFDVLAADNRRHNCLAAVVYIHPVPCFKGLFGIEFFKSRRHKSLFGEGNNLPLGFAPGHKIHISLGEIIYRLMIIFAHSVPSVFGGGHKLFFFLCCFGFFHKDHLS